MDQASLLIDAETIEDISLLGYSEIRVEIKFMYVCMYVVLISIDMASSKSPKPVLIK